MTKPKPSAVSGPSQGEEALVKPHYSGDKSEKFWKQIGQLKQGDHREVYALGVALQDLEGRVLTALRNAKRRSG